MTDPNGFKQENEAAETAEGRAVEEEEVGQNGSATDASRMSSDEWDGNNDVEELAEEEAILAASRELASQMSNESMSRHQTLEKANEEKELGEEEVSRIFDPEQAVLAARELASQMSNDTKSRHQALEKAKEENHFDEILRAVAEAGGALSTPDDPTATITRRRGRSDQRDELFEVTSILFQYEAEAEKKAEEKEANMIANAGVESKSTGAAAPSAADVVSGSALTLDNKNDLSSIPKKVTILEPLPTVEHVPEYDDKPLCGICVIQ